MWAVDAILTGGVVPKAAFSDPNPSPVTATPTPDSHPEADTAGFQDMVSGAVSQKHYVEELVSDVKVRREGVPNLGSLLAGGVKKGLKGLSVSQDDAKLSGDVTTVLSSIDAYLSRLVTASNTASEQCEFWMRWVLRLLDLLAQNQEGEAILNSPQNSLPSPNPRSPSNSRRMRSTRGGSLSPEDASPGTGSLSSVAKKAAMKTAKSKVGVMLDLVAAPPKWLLPKTAAPKARASP